MSLIHLMSLIHHVPYLFDFSRTSFVFSFSFSPSSFSSLVGCDLRIHAYAFSPGLQEFIEAASFLEYLQTGQLLTLEAVQRQLTFDDVDETFLSSIRVFPFCLKK